jgi:hypothetical protein
MREKRIIISCGIFKNELTKALQEDSRFAVEVIWLGSGYHVRTDWLAEKLAKIMEAGKLTDNNDLRILYGRNCLMDLSDDSRVRLNILHTDNCLTAIVGRERLRELERDRTMVITNSWLRDIYLGSSSDFPMWDPDELRMNLGRYDRVLVLDTGLDTFTDEEILTAFDRMGVVLEFETVDLSYFKKLIWDFLT